MNVTSYIIDNCKTGGNIITDNIIPVDTIGDYSNEITGGSILINDSIISNDIINTNEIIGGLLTKTTESECTNECNTCSSKKTIKLMSKFVNATGPENDIVEKIERELKCDSESCVLLNSTFKKFVEKETGNTDIITYDLQKNFKTRGPRNSTDLLSNYNIDETLLRWAREFKEFFPCPFSMIDFKIVTNDFGSINLDNVISGKALYKDPIDGIQRGPFKTYGCVLNTDISTGHGKHWVCIFVDCRSSIWTIEYFNSSGNPPHYDVSEWMENQRSNLLKLHDKVETITVTNLVHQKSNTECGMYVLYYIRSRLDGISYQHFLTKRIDDADVTKFRKHVFRKY